MRHFNFAGAIAVVTARRKSHGAVPTQLNCRRIRCINQQPGKTGRNEEENVMHKPGGAAWPAAMILLNGFIACGAAAAPDGDKPQDPVKCEEALVSPVSGYAVCVKPPGAPVAPPPRRPRPCAAQAGGCATPAAPTADAPK
jgi:hypothetical protein